MKSRQRTLLVVILILLILLLGGLVWYYLSVVQPPRSADEGEAENLEHVASFGGVHGIRPPRAPRGDPRRRPLRERQLSLGGQRLPHGAGR